MKSDSLRDVKVEVSDEVTQCNRNIDEMSHDGDSQRVMKTETCNTTDVAINEMSHDVDSQLVTSHQVMNTETCNTVLLNYNEQATSLNSTGENVEICLLAAVVTDECEPNININNNSNYFICTLGI